MNCTNCGAPMELVGDRDYFVCKYCDHYYFPSADSEGIRLLGKADDSIRCPVCEVPLWIASFQDRYRGHACTKCKGTLLDRDTFTSTLWELRAWASGPPAAQKPFDAAELQRHVRCPLCSKVMQTHPYYGPGTFAIDSCIQCDVVWLDYGELKEAVDAPGRDRGIAFRRSQLDTESSAGDRVESVSDPARLLMDLATALRRFPF